MSAPITGDYTAILVGLARDVIAVEPNPDIVRVLEARLGDEIPPTALATGAGGTRG